MNKNSNLLWVYDVIKAWQFIFRVLYIFELSIGKTAYFGTNAWMKLRKFLVLAVENSAITLSCFWKGRNFAERFQNLVI